MKRISVKGLADFMSAGEAKRRTIVRQFKYPKEEDASAKILYYRKARATIEAYRAGKRDPSWLEDRADQLEVFAGGLTGSSRTLHRNNVRAIRDYAQNFAHRRFVPSSVPRLRLDYGGVHVSVIPDLRATEAGKDKIVKLEFAKNPPTDLEVNVISQLLFEAAQAAGLGMPASSVLYLDVARGAEHRGARVGSRMKTNIVAACETFSNIWDRI